MDHREVTKACRCVTSQWHHSDDTTSNRETEREKGRLRLRKREREKERKREKARTAERGETHVGTKRELKKALAA